MPSSKQVFYVLRQSSIMTMSYRKKRKSAGVESTFLVLFSSGFYHWKFDQFIKLSIVRWENGEQGPEAAALGDFLLGLLLLLVGLLMKMHSCKWCFFWNTSWEAFVGSRISLWVPWLTITHITTWQVMHASSRPCIMTTKRTTTIVLSIHWRP